ncbi:MAG: hypothetical protein CMI15_07525 [Opitutaceae bacterium]|nr:hypothetical protein [Opitutaceae bacterium]
MLDRLKGQLLTVGILIAILLAYVLPYLGATGGPLKTEITTKVAIAIIFFLQGLTLNTRKLLISVTQWRLHIFCQSSIFLISPVLMLLMVLLLGRWIPANLQPGLLFLSILPSAVFSSTVFTANSGGDAGVALFNATLSNVIGVILTPLWRLAMFANANDKFPPIDSLPAKIAFFILLPLVIGQFGRTIIKYGLVNYWGPAIKRTNNGMILFAVFAAFCDSFSQEVWAKFPFSSILLAIIYSTIFLGLLSSLVRTPSRLASYSLSQRIAVFFCSSQKTLAAGVPIAAVVFAGQSGNLAQGPILIPLMIYHAQQLVLAGLISGSLLDRKRQLT